MPTLYGVGAFCGRNPWWVSVLALSISSLLCLGLRSVYVQTDPQKLWVSPTSVAANEQTNFNQLFGPFFRVEQLIFYADRHHAPPVHKPKQSVWSLNAADSMCAANGNPTNAVDDLIDRKYLLQQADIELAIRSAKVTVNNRTYSLEDFCYRPIKGKGCLVTSPFQYWLANRTLLANDPDIKLTTACQTTDPLLKDRAPCMDQNGVPVMRNVVFGGLARDTCHENPDPCGESTPKAKALIVTFLLHNNPDNASYTQAVKEWERQAFIGLAEQASARLLNDTASGMQLTYMAERSVADSLEVQTSQNAFIVVVSYLVMFLYVSLSLGKFTDRIHSRFGLGLTGIVIVLFSLGISMGVCSAIFQLEVTMITLEVVPFLILAIGVDNMFILTNEFDRLAALRGLSPSTGTPRRRTDEHEVLSKILGETMANVGPSITVAAISECLAFLVGALTRIPALTTFCIVAAVAVLADYVLQLTWFAAALILDTRRVRARRYDLFPWARQPISLMHSEKTSSTSQSASGRIDEGGGVIKAFIVKTYAPFITRRTTKLVVLLSSLVFVLLSILGAQHIPLGLEQELAVPTDFYLHEYFRVQTKFGEAGPPAYLVLAGDGIDYTDAKVQMQVNQLIDDFSSIRQYLQLPIFSWLQAFNQWRQMRYFLQEKIEDGSCDCPEQPLDPFPYEELKMTSPFDQGGNVTPNALFYPLVQNFSLIEIDSQCCQSFGLCGAQYAGDLVFRQDPHTQKPNGLLGSRMRFQANALKNQSVFVNTYYYMHAVTRTWQHKFQQLSNAKHGKIQVFPYTLFFVFEEQYTYIQGIALQSVLLALLVVFVSVFLLMDRNLRLSMIVIVCVLSMTVSLLGYLFLWNALAPIATSMNAVSVVNLLACVGLGVEFCVHMTHQFAFSRVNRLGITGDDHTKHALASVGASIISGITLTKFCGIGVLAFAPSMLFRVYFFRMYLGIVLLGFFHGMVLLPVLLSLFGQEAAYPNDFSTFLLSEEQDEMDQDVDGNSQYTEY
jgi:Niemann-Pick C1 protein